MAKIVYRATILVNYAKPLQQDADKLNFINKAVSEYHYPATQTGIKEVKVGLVDMGHSYTPNKAFEDLQNLDMYLPSAQDFLALAHYKDLAIDRLMGNEERSILCICKPWGEGLNETDGDPLIPKMEGVARVRRIRLVLYHYTYDSSTLVLAIKR